MVTPRVLSGMQPTADSFHLGNYLGALRHWVDLQDGHDAFYCVVDLHAITVPHDPEALRRRTRVAAAQYLAAGIDPARSTLFVQSHVRQHAELCWILECLTGMGEAGRMTQFKDKSQKGGGDSASVGLFAYPILQAADIVIYQADRVPVGEDQRQHLELTRDLAQRFNTRFGETFVVPEPHIVKSTGKIYDLQEPTAKMSKSAASQAGVIDLLEPVSSIAKKIKRAVTDTGTDVRFDETGKPGISNLLTIMSAFTGRTVAELEDEFAGQQYGAFKTAVADAVVAALEPFQERYRRWSEDPEGLDTILAQGAERARAVAEETMTTVRDRVGFLAAKG
ncbi:MAG TPA: tryptophan--tRNA ligase [Mycobacteriales bacterium]|jgi:tryptophanyl-tRNA synthetase|nr:tryptophan--tRNA ligase [Mycobacteriales bacterium]